METSVWYAEDSGSNPAEFSLSNLCMNNYSRISNGIFIVPFLGAHGSGGPVCGPGGRTASPQTPRNHQRRKIAPAEQWPDESA